MATRSARCRWASAAPFNEAYEPLLFDVARIPFPAAGRESVDVRGARGAVPTQAMPPRSSSSRWCSAPAACSCIRRPCSRELAQHLRKARRAVHRRRGDDRLGPHRHPVRLRAGRHLARHRLLFEGSHRRLAAAGRDALPPRDFRRALRAGPTPHLLSFELLHRQSDRLRRGARQSADLGVGARARAHRGA